MTHSWLVPALLLAASPTGWSWMSDAVVRRASFDLRCPEEKIEWEDLGNRTFGVEGCGKQATYVVLQTTPLLDSPITRLRRQASRSDED
jgi:hypothetical protein